MGLEACMDGNKPAFRWGPDGIKYSYDPHDFIAKAIARGRACRHGEHYRKRVKTHTKLK